MKHRPAGSARKIPEAGWTILGFARSHLDIPQAAKRPLPVDVAEHIKAGDDGLAVDFFGKVVRLDARLIEWVRRADRQMPPRFRVTLPDRRRETGIAVQGIARLVDRQRHHVELDIGTAANGVFRAGCATDLTRAGGQW